MKILALETATEALSVAVLHGDDLFAFHEPAPRRHGELLLPTVDRLMQAAGLELADLDAIAFGRGPGAFTGVRIAVAVAQGLAFGAGVPLVGVSTLAALAHGALEAGHERVVAAIDARMGEIYACWYTRDAVGDEWLGPAQAFRAPDGDWYGVGTGFGAYGGAFALTLAGTEPAALPSAAAVARLAVAAVTAGRTVAPEDAAPVYLRDKVTS